MCGDLRCGCEEKQFSFFLLFEVACLVWCVTIQVLGMGAKNMI